MHQATKVSGHVFVYSILPLSTIFLLDFGTIPSVVFFVFLLDFGTIPTVWYFLFFYYILELSRQCGIFLLFY